MDEDVTKKERTHSLCIFEDIKKSDNPVEKEVLWS